MGDINRIFRCVHHGELNWYQMTTGTTTGPSRPVEEYGGGSRWVAIVNQREIIWSSQSFHVYRDTSPLVSQSPTTPPSFSIVDWSSSGDWSRPRRAANKRGPRTETRQGRVLLVRQRIVSVCSRKIEATDDSMNPKRRVCAKPRSIRIPLSEVVRRATPITPSRVPVGSGQAASAWSVKLNKTRECFVCEWVFPCNKAGGMDHGFYKMKFPILVYTQNYCCCTVLNHSQHKYSLRKKMGCISVRENLDVNTYLHIAYHVSGTRYHSIVCTAVMVYAQ